MAIMIPAAGLVLEPATITAPRSEAVGVQQRDDRQDDEHADDDQPNHVRHANRPHVAAVPPRTV